MQQSVIFCWLTTFSSFPSMQLVTFSATSSNTGKAMDCSFEWTRVSLIVTSKEPRRPVVQVTLAAGTFAFKNSFNS